MPPRSSASSGSRRHDWEIPKHAWEVNAAVADNIGWANADSDSAFEEEPATPGKEFVDHMYSLLLSGTLNNKQFCIAMHHASESGIAEALRLPPWCELRALR